MSDEYRISPGRHDAPPPPKPLDGLGGLILIHIENEKLCKSVSPWTWEERTQDVIEAAAEDYLRTHGLLPPGDPVFDDIEESGK